MIFDDSFWASDRQQSSNTTGPCLFCVHLSFVTEDPKLLARNYIVKCRLYESAPVNINKKDLGFGTWS